MPKIEARHRSFAIFTGALVSMAAACGAGDSQSPSQNGPIMGTGGFPPFGMGGAAGFVSTGTGGATLTGQGGIPIGQAGVGQGGIGQGGVGQAGFGQGGIGQAGVGQAGSIGTGGDLGMAGAQGTGGAGQGSTADIQPGTGGCGWSLPAVADYETPSGPFQTTTVNNTGPDGNYTMIRPTTLGPNGFKHPAATWGNGITTNPTYYPQLLSTIAAHGFIIIASNSTSVTAQLMTSGLDWLVQQNNVAGDFQGKIDTKCLLTIGYSLGGGAAVDSGSHADVIATVSMHGVTGNSAALHAPLLLFTSQTDTFVTAAQFVTPTYNASTVQTFYATLSSAGDPNNLGHIIPVGGAGPERGPMVAWMRLWAYNDQGAKQYFYGDSCILCVDPWTNPQRKNWK